MLLRNVLLSGLDSEKRVAFLQVSNSCDSMSSLIHVLLLLILEGMSGIKI